jgi:hypothetical protein
MPKKKNMNKEKIKTEIKIEEVNNDGNEDTISNENINESLIENFQEIKINSKEKKEEKISEQISMFLKVNEKKIFSLSSPPKFPFVNREKEIITIISFFVSNSYNFKNNPENWKTLTTIFIDQMSGRLKINNIKVGNLLLGNKLLMKLQNIKKKY